MEEEGVPLETRNLQIWIINNQIKFEPPPPNSAMILTWMPIAVYGYVIEAHSAKILSLHLEYSSRTYTHRHDPEEVWKYELSRNREECKKYWLIRESRSLQLV